MSSYLSVYIKPKEIDKKILLFNYSRSSEIYQFFYENNLSIYIYGGTLLEPNKEKRFRELTTPDFDYALSELNDEITKDVKKLALMKELKSKADIEDIMLFEEYLQEKEELKSQLEIIRKLIPDEYSCNDIEAVYTNYD